MLRPSVTVLKAVAIEDLEIDEIEDRIRDLWRAFAGKELPATVEELAPVVDSLHA